VSKIKRISVLTLVTLFTLTFLVGCALFATDVAASNNLVVARISTGNRNIDITRRQLDDAFGSWGFQFVQQGLTPEEAATRTLDSLIDREIMVYRSINQYFGSYETAPANATWEQVIYSALTPWERERAWANVFESFQSSIDSIDATVRTERNLNDPAPLPEDPAGRPVFTPFDHYINVDGDEFRLNIDRFIERPSNDPVPTIEGFIAGAFVPRDNTIQEVAATTETRERILRILRNREQGLRYSDDTWQGVMTRELERMFREEKRQIHISRFQDMFTQGMMNAGHDAFMEFNNRFQSDTSLEVWQNTVAIKSQDYIDDIVRRATDHYQRNVLRAINNFRMGTQTIPSIREQLIQPNSLSDIHWIPQSIVNQYFTVSHILVSFSDQDRERVEQLEHDLRYELNGVDQDRFDLEIGQLRDNLRIRARNNQGHEVGNPLSALEVLNEVNAAVNTSNDRQLAFKEQIYRFNGDPGMENPTFEYVIGIEVDGVVTSQMVQEFTDSARALHATGNQGATSGLVWSQFGAHIIMYTRNLSDFIYSSNENLNMAQQRLLLETNYRHFLFATQTSYGNQTFFDTIVQGLTRGEFQEAERGVRIAFRQEVGSDGIRTFPRRFRDIWR